MFCQAKKKKIAQPFYLFFTLDSLLISNSFQNVVLTALNGFLVDLNDGKVRNTGGSVYYGAALIVAFFILDVFQSFNNYIFCFVFKLRIMVEV